jgi:uncharacterized protein
VVRIVVIADDDTLVGKSAKTQADVLISCGDLWDETILRAADAYQCERVFAVRGNHDTSAPFPPGIDDLHLKVIEYGGFRFGGFHGSWRYKPRGHYMWEQWEVGPLLRGVPPVDVLVTHNSPRGIHECDTDVHQGFDAFLEYIDRARPRYVIHGHQHVQRVTSYGDTTIVGVFGEHWLTIE